MSLITYNGIVDLIEAGVIKNTSSEMINAASLDVRLGSTMLRENVSRGDVVDLASKQVPAMSEIGIQPDGTWWLLPKEFALASTMEVFNLPNDVACEFRLKSSLARAGLDAALAMWGDPGWHGSVMTLELINNLNQHVLALKPGMKIGQMIFLFGEEVPELQSYAYKGQYNNDKQTQPSKGVR